IDLDGLGVVGNRPVVVALGLVGIAAVGVNLGEIGIDLDGLGVVGDRPVVVALGLVGIAAVGVGDCTVPRRFSAAIEDRRAGDDRKFEGGGIVLVHAPRPLR